MEMKAHAHRSHSELYNFVCLVESYRAKAFEEARHVEMCKCGLDDVSANQESAKLN